MRLLQSFFAVRWLRTLAEFMRGSIVHPSATLIGGWSRIRISRGVSVGARCRLAVAGQGQIALGVGCWLASDVHIESSQFVFIGDGTTIQRGTSIHGDVRIGIGCLFAPNVYLSSRSHSFRLIPHLPIREQERQADSSTVHDRPVRVQDDCWFGVNVVIGPGVTIGKGAIIGANSVVLDNVAPYSVVAGAPARPVGERLKWQPPAVVDLSIAEDRVYVLSGVPVRNAHGQVIAVRPAEFDRLTIAIARSEYLVMQFQATADLRIRVGSKDHDLRSGNGKVVLLARQMPASDSVSLLELEVLPPGSVSELRVEKVTAVMTDGRAE